MGERGIRIAVVVVDLFAAVSAFAGAIGLVVGYMDIPLSVLRTTPFADFTVPALLLDFVVGGSALAAAAAGCIMVGWMSVEIVMIGPGVWVQALYFAVGLLMMGLAGLLQRAESHQPGVSCQLHAHTA